MLVKRKSLQTFILYGLLLILSMTSCATAPPYPKYVGSVSYSNSSKEKGLSFKALWDYWTVQIGGAARNGSPGLLGNLFAMSAGEGRGGSGSEFPLQITATLMDSSLIEAGLQHYADELEMTSEEKTDFRSVYFKRYDVENHLLIWCKLQTTSTELFLDPNRWIIYIEDDAINQHEPVRILEESQPSHPVAVDMPPGIQPDNRHTGWEVHQKNWMLCFPKQDYYKNPVLSEKVKFLKLVFQLSDDEKTKAEGEWVFEK